jgi:hypothetical protein
MSSNSWRQILINASFGLGRKSRHWFVFQSILIERRYFVKSVIATIAARASMRAQALRRPRSTNRPVYRFIRPKGRLVRCVEHGATPPYVVEPRTADAAGLLGPAVIMDSLRDVVTSLVSQKRGYATPLPASDTPPAAMATKQLSSTTHPSPTPSAPPRKSSTPCNRDRHRRRQVRL